MRPDPLVGDHIATRWTQHEVPRLVGKKSRVLLFHRATPVRIRQGIADRGGYRRDPRLSLGGGESRSLRRHPPSHHGMDMPRIPMDDRRVVHLRLCSRGSRRRRRRRRLRCSRRRSLRSRRRHRCRRRTTPVHLHRLSVPRRERYRGRASAGEGTGAARGAAGDTGSVRGTTGGPGAARGATAGTRATLGAAGITKRCRCPGKTCR